MSGPLIGWKVKPQIRFRAPFFFFFFFKKAVWISLQVKWQDVEREKIYAQRLARGNI